MELFVHMIISMTVGAIIGGATNYLAIKMLFHPRRPIYIGKWKLPFTPGLIPKRKDEIARSLGNVVGEYLVTSTGLKRVMTEAAFEGRIIRKLSDIVEKWSQYEGTIRELLEEYIGEEKLTHFEKKVRHGSKNIVEQGVDWLWHSQQWKRRVLVETIPAWNEQLREASTKKIVHWITKMIKDEIGSVHGERLLRQLTSRFLNQSGGWFGVLAGVFIDEQKMSAKIKEAIVGQLEHPTIQLALENIVREKIIDLEQQTWENVIERITSRPDGYEMLKQRLGEQVESGEWLQSLLASKVKDWHVQFEWIQDRLPQLVSYLLGFAADHLERIISAFNLPKMVEEQVSDFPVEQVEHVVLSVSGREFRAITWLGAVLGGGIGLFQAIFTQLYLMN